MAYLDPQQEFISSYADQFTVLRADTPELLDEAFRLRYQVYCVENAGFENPEDHQDGRERDGEDDRSVHALLVHRRTGAYAGTVRVILPADNTALWRPLPMHRLLEAQDKRLLGQLPPGRDLAEISRFAVSKEFRRRCGEERYADANWPGKIPRVPRDRRTAPYITFGLLRAVLEICLERHVPWVGAVMEPALMRIFKGFGVIFEPVGGPVEYHGTRWCCVARIADLVDHGCARGTLLSRYTRQDDDLHSRLKRPRAVAPAA